MTTASQLPAVPPARHKESGIKSVTSGITGVYRSWQHKIGWGGAKKNLPQQFKEWVTGAALAGRESLYASLPDQARAFYAWLTSGLSAPESKAFTQQVADFCAVSNFNLAWLTDPELARDPELKQSLEDAVSLYCLASWKVNQAQTDVKAFATWKKWQRDPLGKEQRELTQRLFGRLVERGLSSPPSPQLFLASEKDRLGYAVQAIRQVAEHNMPAIKTALKEL